MPFWRAFFAPYRCSSWNCSSLRRRSYVVSISRKSWLLFFDSALANFSKLSAKLDGSDTVTGTRLCFMGPSCKRKSYGPIEAASMRHLRFLLRRGGPLTPPVEQSSRLSYRLSEAAH